MLDLESFLDSHHIPYSSTRDGVVIQCPYCEDDPSQHLAWNPIKGWHCWRNPEHAGRKPHKLICKLIGCSYEQAAAIVGSTGPSLDYLDRKHSQQPSVKELSFPKEFRPITYKGSGVYYFEYLVNREYHFEDVSKLVQNYNLQFSTRGSFHHRIIIPIYYENQLVCWTGRTISSATYPRYLTLGTEQGALLSPKDTLYQYDQLLSGGKVLVLTEGPFDALKLDLYGKPYGVRATCLFGTGVSDDQVELLQALRRRFSKVCIIGDFGGVGEGNLWQLNNRLTVDVFPLPSNDVEDPGALTPNQAKQMARKLERSIQ